MNLSFDPLNQNYCSRRYPIYASNGMVNCSNPLAASAGLSILQKGGNADLVREEQEAVRHQFQRPCAYAGCDRQDQG